MTTSAKKTFGTTLARNGNTIAELTNIGSPKLSAGEINVTNHQSPDGYEEFVQGIRSAGEVPLEGNFISSDTNGQIGLLTDFNAGTMQSFVITFPDGTTWTFTAFVKSFEMDDASVDGKLSFKVSLKVSGKPVLGISTAANLTGLVVTTGTLVPAFAGATKVYVVNIATGVSSVTVTPTCAAATSIEVDGNVVASGQASSAITLGAAGSVTTIEVVTKETGKADNVYTLHLTRAAA